MPLILQVAKMQPPGYEDHDHNDEEALSLCDFPVSAGNEDQENEETNPTVEGDGFDFDFDFGSLIGSIPALESDMCAADEVFSGGQMLPFRHSVSSEVGLSGFRIPRSVSRSESMDRAKFGSRSSSSRSSSTRSHQSTTSTSTSNSSYHSSNNPSNSMKAKAIPKPKARNQFHSYPSPKPQIRASSARLSTSTPPSGSKSTMWQVLRLGLIRTPELELQGRTSNYNKTFNKCTIRNTNNNNSNNKVINNNDPVIGYKIGDLVVEMKRRNNEFMSEDSRNIRSGGIFKSCKCSVGAIEPLPTRVRGDFNRPKKAIGGQKMSLANQVLNEDKVLAQKKQEQQHHQKNRVHKQLRQGKQATSHHRTFEWLRDLSHSSVLNS